MLFGLDFCWFSWVSIGFEIYFFFVLFLWRFFNFFIDFFILFFMDSEIFVLLLC